MATYNWSALSDGQVINFDPAVDKINIDIPGLQAPQLQDWNWYLKGGTPTFLIRAADKSVEFAGLTIENFRPDTLSFASGALFLAGDQLAGTSGDADANLLVGSAAGDVLFGLGGNDTLRGGGGDDILNGGEGNDLLDGGAGFDMAFYARDSFSPILANLMTGKIYQSGSVDTVINIEGVRGGMGDDTYIGNAADNLFRGLGGVDYFNGHDGFDIVRYREATSTQGARVDLAANKATNDGFGSTDFLFSIEGVIGTTFADVIKGDALDNWLRGDAGNDTLSGGGGNDTLDGGAGSDRMSGGSGNDTYYVDASTDVVSETSTTGGIDTVVSTVTRTLGAYQENLTLGGNRAINGTGNSLANTLIGNDAANRLDGGSGRDILSGGGGNDNLKGGLGADKLTGGSGKDTFVFSRVQDSGTSSSSRDIIYDFTRGSDRIHLSAIDANAATTTSNEAFTYIGSRAFSANATGQLRYTYDATKGFGVLSGSTDADTAAEFTIQIVGVTSLSSSDFVL